MSEMGHIVEKASGSNKVSAYTELMLVYVQRCFHVCSRTISKGELFAVPAKNEEG